MNKLSSLKCGICWENITSDSGELESCTHIFCFKCIYQWSSIENNCPACKKSFTKIFKRKHRPQVAQKNDENVQNFSNHKAKVPSVPDRNQPSSQRALRTLNPQDLHAKSFENRSKTSIETTHFQSSHKSSPDDSKYEGNSSDSTLSPDSPPRPSKSSQTFSRLKRHPTASFPSSEKINEDLETLIESPKKNTPYSLSENSPPLAATLPVENELPRPSTKLDSSGNLSTEPRIEPKKEEPPISKHSRLTMSDITHDKKSVENRYPLPERSSSWDPKLSRPSSPLNCTQEDKRRLHRDHIAMHVRTLLQPLFNSDDLTREQFIDIAKTVTSKMVSSFSENELNKPLALSPQRKKFVKQFIRTELKKLNT